MILILQKIKIEKLLKLDLNGFQYNNKSLMNLNEKYLFKKIF
jgi:hypothetical protein